MNELGVDVNELVESFRQNEFILCVCTPAHTHHIGAPVGTSKETTEDRNQEVCAVAGIAGSVGMEILQGCVTGIAQEALFSG